MDTRQGWWKGFRAETFYWIIQMAPIVLQRLVHSLQFNAVTYERPHSKTLQASLNGGLFYPISKPKLLSSQCLNARQLLPLEKFQRGSASRRNMTDSIRYSCLVHRRDGITSSHNTEG